MLNAVFEGHQQRIYVLEALELGLINLLDDALIVRRQVNWLVGEFRWEVCQVLSEKRAKSCAEINHTLKVDKWLSPYITIGVQTRLERRRHLFLFQQVPIDLLEEWVIHDVHESSVTVAPQSIRRVLVEKSFQY